MYALAAAAVAGRALAVWNCGEYVDGLVVYDDG